MRAARPHGQYDVHECVQPRRGAVPCCFSDESCHKCLRPQCCRLMYSILNYLFGCVCGNLLLWTDHLQPLSSAAQPTQAQPMAQEAWLLSNESKVYIAGVDGQEDTECGTFW